MIPRKITATIFAVQIISSILFAQNKIGFVQSDRIRSEYEEFKDAESQLQLEYRQVNMRYNSMIVEVIKDSVKRPYYATDIEVEPVLHKGEKGKVYDNYSIDDGIFSLLS